MNIIKTTVQAVIKRPFILILIAVFMLVMALFNAFIPIMAIIIGIVNMAGGGIFESMLSILQMLIDPGILPTLLIFLGVMTLLLSIAAGILLPGYLPVVGDAIAKGTNRQSTKSLFIGGLKGNFFKFFFMTIKTILLAILLVVFLTVASVPAIIVTRAALTTKPDLMFGALFIVFVTVGVLFMCFSFFKSYVFMWYIAASNGEKKPFKVGKAVADRRFWSLILNFFVFDVVFAAAIYLIYLSGSRIVRYTAGWAFASVFFITLVVYLVKTYRDS